MDAQSEDPLEGVHVILSGTSYGAVTDDQGRYRLTGVPSGAHRLYASRVGYVNTSVDTLVKQGKQVVYDIALEPETVMLDEMEVVDTYDEDWQDDLEYFKSKFIGESRRSDYVEIENPEVLSFDSNWWGRFTARASGPLEITNRVLGYRITYFLEEFETTGMVTRWDGEPLFEEMEPEDPIQQRLWEANREEAFYGSLRHFLLALINDRLSEEGYLVYRHEPEWEGSMGSSRPRPTTADRVVSDNEEEEELYELDFRGHLEVVYTEAGEERRFIRWQRTLTRSPAENQTSYLELNERPIHIDRQAEVRETYGATRYGYFAFQRLADLTPREYRPENYREED